MRFNLCAYAMLEAYGLQAFFLFWMYTSRSGIGSGPGST